MFCRFSVAISYLIIMVTCQVIENEAMMKDVAWDPLDDTAVEFDDGGPFDGFWPWTSTSSTTAPQDEQQVPTDCPLCKCGVANTEKRIVGGQPAHVHEYPWIGLILDDRNRVVCGASLINDRYALTAAHCIVGMDVPKLTVIFLAHNRSDTSEPERIYATIQSSLVHPGYAGLEDPDIQSPDNDIAILHLDKVLKFTDTLNPVCLPLPRLSYKGVNATVAGWGRESLFGSSPDILHEVSLPVLSNAECKMTNTAKVFNITENVLCAGFPQGGKDACRGDSGGPLVYRRRFVHQLIGVVSGGYDCAEPNFPGVYVRVNRYLSWIRSNTVEACYCEETLQ